MPLLQTLKYASINISSSLTPHLSRIYFHQYFSMTTQTHMSHKDVSYQCPSEGDAIYLALREGLLVPSKGQFSGRTLLVAPSGKPFPVLQVTYSGGDCRTVCHVTTYSTHCTTQAHTCIQQRPLCLSLPMLESDWLAVYPIAVQQNSLWNITHNDRVKGLQVISILTSSLSLQQFSHHPVSTWVGHQMGLLPGVKVLTERVYQ